MTTATKRICINKSTYMKVDGQWQIVLSGSVIDLDASTVITGDSLLPGFSETAGTLAAHGTNTTVRNLRTS